MNTFRAILAAVLITAAAPGHSQPDITGTWSGQLPAGPDATVEIHFIISRDDDGYATVLSSPDPGGIQDLPATSTSFENNELVLAVDNLSGRYEGTFDNGRFSGNWHQQGQAIPLDLVPYVESVLTEADQDLLRGSWVGELTTQGIALAIVFRFEQDDNGEFAGYLDSPDQGATGIDVTNIRLADGMLSFAIPQISGEYTATFDGDSMTGSFTQLGMPTPLDMTRGEYVQRGIELSREAMDRLEGSWVGRVQNPAGTLSIVFRFEETPAGGMAAFLDSPEQGASGIPINEVSLEGDELDLTIAAAAASFTATLSADEMTGTWAQGNQSQPVTMARGEYAPAATALQLSDAAYARLAGTWSGELGPLELFIRFETNAEGERIATLEVPAQDTGRLNLAEASLDGDQLSIAIPAIGANFNGTLDGDAAVGQWDQGPATNPLTLTRSQ